MQTTLTVNGEERRLDHDVRTSLLDALRDHLGLTGTKKGCDHGQCGACTILLNGKRINACLTLAAMHEGDEVTTIEGLGTPDAMSPLQSAFVTCDGYQCGFCTAGQIMSATGMLAELKEGMPSHVSPSLSDRSEMTDPEVAERMSGNLCRCSAYPFIREAIAMASEEK
ncbi:2Fe-2S iron-sulfur cluster-binding protein [Pseudooceanicola nanhaiensis]|uniref:2Fe-2S iron-sulfur cluster-binding protein n=1 Tax=Pseudooceanicola nanhaiensis TaxID=375761 RepID=UPI0035187546